MKIGKRQIMGHFMRLDGKIALVTGASRGIGRSIAGLLSARGATVFGTATSESGAAEISKYLKINSRGLVLDVREPALISSVVKSINDQFGTIDILVNNAAITQDKLLIRMRDDEWTDIIETNLTSVFRLSKSVLRGMVRKRFGRIINISSMVGFTGNLGQANYSAAKSGIAGFTKSVAREVASRGITVNTVAPGFINTDMTEVLRSDKGIKALEKIPTGRLGSPEDVAFAVAFLASQEAGYITGETLHVNGGMLMV